MQKKLFFTMILLLALLLAACSNGSGETEPAVYYKATFVLDGVVYAQQQVEEGGTPTQVALDIPGLTLLDWQNAAVPHLPRRPMTSKDTSGIISLSTRLW